MAPELSAERFITDLEALRSPEELRKIQRYFKAGDLDATFAIAELLLADTEDLIHKAVGGWLRAAGAKDRERLLRFLVVHAAVMPRTMLRYAIEHLEPALQQQYRAQRNPAAPQAGRKERQS